MYSEYASDLEQFRVNLSFFAGPMDLLLHLVTQKEVPIEQVQMSEVVDQYLDIVNTLSKDLSKEIDLEKASEFLVIAATLMVIKSKALIPKDENTDDESVEDEYSRFFEDLRSRLIAYQTTKLRAEALIASPQLGIDTFQRIDRSAVQVPPEELGEGEDISRLGQLFLSLVKRVGGFARKMMISIEPISIVSHMMRIVDALKIRNPEASVSTSSKFKYYVTDALNLEDTSKQVTGFAVKNAVLGSFIAILELAKRGLISISYDAYSDTVLSSLAIAPKIVDATSASELELVSEFDEPAAENKEENKVVSIEDYRNTDTSSTEINTPIDTNTDQEKKIGNV